MYRVEHARERGKRRLQRGLTVGIVREEAKRSTDQGVGLAQFVSNPVETVGEGDVTRPRHQQTERDRLRVAIRKRFIGRAREQEFPPVLREVRERSRPLVQLLRNLFAQQPAEAGGDDSELGRRAGWLRFPLEEVSEQRYETVRRCQLAAGCRDIALQMNDPPLKLAVPPKAERVAVGVDQIGKGLELRPLLLIVLVLEAARISPLARRFDFDKANQGVSACDGIVGPRLEVSERSLADCHDCTGWKSRELGQIPNKSFQRRAQLVLRRTARTGVRELRFRFGAKRGNGLLKCHARSLASSRPTNPSDTRR